jgi:hypothetical protein
VIALKQKGFDMMKVVNLCNQCDVNRKLCSTHLVFGNGSSFSEKWDYIKAIFFNQETTSNLVYATHF